MSNSLQNLIQQIVILAGGKGTRLSEFTNSLPKPVVEIHGKPLITYLCNWAYKNTIAQVLVAAGYKQEILKRKLIDYYELQSDVFIKPNETIFAKPQIPSNCEILIKDTGPETDTAERLFAFREELSKSNYFMLTYADTLTDLEIQPLVKFALEHNREITMCVGYPDARYGEISMDNELVTGFYEKKTPQFFVNRGFFVIKSSIFNYWTESFKSFEQDVLPYFVNKKEVVAFKTNCWFHSVDSIKDIHNLELYMLNKRINQ